ncbi:MAG: response regulator [bacterium]|nr:response regulator [bacterium]
MDQQQKKTILVVEDNMVYQRALTEKLESEGFAVLSAIDGEEGLSIAIKEHPNLILLDLAMPKMDGMTMLRRLRDHNEWGKTVPVFILTALSSADEQRNRDIAELEPTYFLNKSNITPSSLIKKIQDRLGL